MNYQFFSFLNVDWIGIGPSSQLNQSNWLQFLVSLVLEIHIMQLVDTMENVKILVVLAK